MLVILSSDVAFFSFLCSCPAFFHIYTYFYVFSDSYKQLHILFVFLSFRSHLFHRLIQSLLNHQSNGRTVCQVNVLCLPGHLGDFQMVPVTGDAQTLF